MEKMTAVETGSTQERLLFDFLTEDDLARELDLSRKTLLRWGKDGRGPKRTKIGRRVLYRRDSVRAWLAACEADPHRRDRRFGTRSSRGSARS